MELAAVTRIQGLQAGQKDFPWNLSGIVEKQSFSMYSAFSTLSHTLIHAGLQGSTGWQLWLYGHCSWTFSSPWGFKQHSLQNTIWNNKHYQGRAQLSSAKSPACSLFTDAMQQAQGPRHVTHVRILGQNGILWSYCLLIGYWKQSNHKRGDDLM